MSRGDGVAPVRPGGHCIRRRDNYEGSRKKYSTATVGLEQEQLINVERRSSCKSPRVSSVAHPAAGPSGRAGHRPDRKQHPIEVAASAVAVQLLGENTAGGVSQIES